MEAYDMLQIGRGSTIDDQTIVYQYPRHHKYAPRKLMLYDPAIWFAFISDYYGTQTGFYLTIKWNANAEMDNIKISKWMSSIDEPHVTIRLLSKATNKCAHTHPHPRPGTYKIISALLCETVYTNH